MIRLCIILLVLGKSVIFGENLPLGCFQSLYKTGSQIIIVKIPVADGGTLGRNANVDCCTSPDVDPSGTIKSGFILFANVARHRSKKQYMAQKFGAQYACVSPLLTGNSLEITINNCPLTRKGPNDNRNPRITVKANFTRFANDVH